MIVIRRRRILFSAVISIYLAVQSIACFSQDYTWWNELHNWDGVTHWSNYMKLAPAFMGPNALPVPEIKTGQLPDSPSLLLAGESHINSGDFTNDLYTEIYFPLYSKRVGLNLSIVPFETYRMDDATRDERISRDFDGKGIASGDLYIGTFIQILQDRKNLPDLLLSLNLRTASGNNLVAARYTDTPGYFFDLTAGKDFDLPGSVVQSIRPYALIGFYVWQTNLPNYYQNDAVQYGLGTDIQFRKLTLSNQLGGYRGYIGNGDRPMVYRISLKSNFESALNFELRFQQGIVDFGYSSIRIAVIGDLGGMVNQKTSK